MTGIRPREGRTWSRQLSVNALYLLSGFPIAVVSFTVVLTLFTAGAALLITLVGLPVVVLTWFVAKQFARLERRRIGWVSGRPVTEPAYRRWTGGGIRGVLDAALDPQAIRDGIHGISVFAVSCITWTTAVVWASVPPLAITEVIAGNGNGADARRVPDWLGVDSQAGRSWLYIATASVCLVTLPLVVRGLAAAQAGFGRSLLAMPGAGRDEPAR